MEGEVDTIEEKEVAEENVLTNDEPTGMGTSLKPEIEKRSGDTATVVASSNDAIAKEKEMKDDFFVGNSSCHTKLANPVDGEGGIAVVDIPESTSASQQQELQDEKHKEEEWTETTDLASGNICYNNSITGETSWSKPDPRQKVDDDNLSAEEDYSVDEPTPVESEVASVGTNRDSIGIPEPTNRFPTDEGVVAVVDVPESASMSQLQELREGESVPRVSIRVIKIFFYSHRPDFFG